MKNGWTGGQYSLVRAILGAYLAIHFATLIPWAGEVFSDQGVLPSAALSLWAQFFPNALALFDSPAAITVALILGVILSVMFAVGWRDRPAALGLWYIWACLLGRNPLILNPSIPYIGWLLLAHYFLPAAPYGSRDAIGRADPGNGWRLPQPMFAAAWTLLAVTYSYSGWTKLMSPSWFDGTAFVAVLENPLVRGHWLPQALLSLPVSLLKAVTWGALAAELLFAPLAYFARLRPLLWAALFAMHLSLIGLIDFADLSLGMAIFHLFTFDPTWLRPATPGAKVFYDGTCALCNGFVRFILSEDRIGRIAMAPLGSDAFRRANPPPRLPDSVAVLTADGRWLTKSTAVRHVLGALGGYWRLIAALAGTLPITWLDGLYDMVASRRKFLNDMIAPCPILPRHLARRLMKAS